MILSSLVSSILPATGKVRLVEIEGIDLQVCGGTHVRSTGEIGGITVGGGKLTGVGGTIVASVFGRLLRLDKTTYWHAHGFKPTAKFSDKGGLLAGMMNYAEANRDKIAHADDLING